MRTANLHSMCNDWKADTNSMTKLRAQINDAANYAQIAGKPIPDSTLVDSALICISCSNAYKQEYIQFK